MQEKKSLGLLPKLLLGISGGVVIGAMFSTLQIELPIRILATFNGLFSNFLSFVIPLLILSFVTIGIADLGRGADRLLGISVGAAYFSTIFFTLMAMLLSWQLFPIVLSHQSIFQDLIENPKDFLLKGYFTIEMPPVLNVMSALLLAFVLGLGLASKKEESNTLFDAILSFQKIVEKVIHQIIIPLLPLHIAGVFANMSYSGKALHVMIAMAIVFTMILSYHFLTLITHFTLAGLWRRENPLRLFLYMIPSYMTALGTQSSVASIPVSRQQMKEAGVQEDIANFAAPLFATIHMPGSAITISTIAFALAYMTGLEISILQAIEFILMLGIVMVAAPGVPGGGVMAALVLLESNLGFNETMLALTIAMHLAQDSFGTACNVTADGALALQIDTLFKRKQIEA
ncbi:dicarboxylate/amino acid:cation symporter [Entomospira entomophila]|uniref:Dicarboxylate/amino acid:cation symporter n=1 Tax=Entomospira entomophila TaxID=2719988 RepID=A0A968G9Z1_9SPIO|nr:dicarboxylate/amino acid:cation symporter [Entomospira entomophilus]NIZ40746.1 dicarboxylate/amino acid:cation symporter [Entomospira entomophilus]WDI34959.1 dicarboxylate/amino acid:cation symporter [Entomospira entomophilus]